MSKKTYNYPLPEHWRGGTGPRGVYNSTKKDFNAYFRDWDELNTALEELTGLKVTAYDPGVNLTRIDERNNRSTIQLPMWFAKILVYGKPEEKKPEIAKRAVKKEPDKEPDKVYCRQEVGCTCPECLGFIPGMG